MPLERGANIDQVLVDMYIPSITEFEAEAIEGT